MKYIDIKVLGFAIFLFILTFIVLKIRQAWKDFNIIQKTGVILFYVFTTVFFWKQNFDLSQPLDSNITSAYFTAMSSLLSVVTIMLVDQQLREMRKDRTTTVTPDLFPIGFPFTPIAVGYAKAAKGLFVKLLKDEIENEDYIFYQIITSKDILNSETESYPIRKINMNTTWIKLKNIGLASGKEIQIQWSFNDENKLVKYFEENHLIDDQSKIQNPKDLFTLIDKISFIKEDGYTFIPVPIRIAQLACTIVNENDSLKEFYEIGPLLRIEYQNILNQKTERSYKIGLDFLGNDSKLTFASI